MLLLIYSDCLNSRIPGLDEIESAPQERSMSRGNIVITPSNDGSYVIQVPATTMYILFGLIVVLLMMNVSCLCYMNLCKKQQPRNYQYSKAAMESDSDV